MKVQYRKVHADTGVHTQWVDMLSVDDVFGRYLIKPDIRYHYEFRIGVGTDVASGAESGEASEGVPEKAEGVAGSGFAEHYSRTIREVYEDGEADEFWRSINRGRDSWSATGEVPGILGTGEAAAWNTSRNGTR